MLLWQDQVLIFCNTNEESGVAWLGLSLILFDVGGKNGVVNCGSLGGLADPSPVG